MIEPCRACDHPREGHGIRYAAIVGDHEWIDPGEAPAPPRRAVRDDDPCPVEVAQAAMTPRIVDHPDGGITYPLDPARTWPDPPESPSMMGYIRATPPPIPPRPFLAPALDQVARDLQRQDRPSIIRRILNATKRSST